MVGDQIESGHLACQACGLGYPVTNFIPRFVPPENYAKNFGFQWNRFPRTQLDSYSGVPISRDRFLRETGWAPDELTGKHILDAGCGAGRFAEVALSCGAKVVALDYSGAVDACWANLGSHLDLNVVQGDLYALPFRPEVFDFIYCFGVLFCTPDPRGAFSSLMSPLRPKGRLAVDAFAKTGLKVCWPKYWLRPFTKRMDPIRLSRIIDALTPVLLSVSTTLGRIPRFGGLLRNLVPVANYDGIYPLDHSQLLEWGRLDTFDMLSPAHDHPVTVATLIRWFEECGFTAIDVFQAGHLVGRGTRPAARDPG